LRLAASDLPVEFRVDSCETQKEKAVFAAPNLANQSGDAGEGIVEKVFPPAAEAGFENVRERLRDYCR